MAQKITQQANSMVEAATKRRIYTVSRLNQEVKYALESGFGTVSVQAELSNFSRPSSGHFYFTLKDARSQIKCAMFKSSNRHLTFEPQSGDEVLVRGKISLYEARGDYQLIVDKMEPAGAGDLQQKFEATKKALELRGWFDQSTKQALPDMPQRIGIVTSSTGAAVRDVLQVLARRSPQAKIIIYPTLVQGATAAPNIVQAIKAAERRNEVDVLLLVRGGGSIEDLWAFNEEIVAQAIFECQLPLVSGVGHEVDFTIADLVADVRAPTPSVAAELSTPDEQIMVQRVASAQATLTRLMRNQLSQQQTQLKSLDERLKMRHPKRLLEDRSQRIDELEQRLQRAMQAQRRQQLFRVEQLMTRLNAHSPAQQLYNLQVELNNTNRRLNSAMQNQLQASKNRWQIASSTLNTVSPLATLDRGFAVVKHNDKVVSDASVLAQGDTISTQVAQGTITSTVESVKQK